MTLTKEQRAVKYAEETGQPVYFTKYKYAGLTKRNRPRWQKDKGHYFAYPTGNIEEFRVNDVRPSFMTDLLIENCVRRKAASFGFYKYTDMVAVPANYNPVIFTCDEFDAFSTVKSLGTKNTLPHVYFEVVDSKSVPGLYEVAKVDGTNVYRLHVNGCDWVLT